MADINVNVFNPDGELRQLPFSVLDRAMKEGYRIATREDLRRHEIGERIKQTPGGGAVSAIASATGEAANMMTLGAFKPALKAIAPESSRVLEVATEQQPEAATVGMLGGFGGSMLVPSRALQAVTQAGKGVASVAPQGLKTVTQYATEGALVSLPSGVSKVFAEQDPVELAEEVAAGMALGGFLGGAVGAGGALKKAISQQLGKIEPATIGRRLGLTAANRAALGEDKFKDVVSWIKEKDIEGVFNSSSSIHEAVSKIKTQAGKSIGRSLQEADKIGPLFDLNKLVGAVSKIRKEYPDHAITSAEKTGLREVTRKIKALSKLAEDSRWIPLSEAQKTRASLGKQAYDEWSKGKSSKKVFQAVEREIDSLIEEGLDQASILRPELAQVWKDAKKDYFVTSKLEKPLRRLVSKEQNNILSLSDLVSAGVGASIAGIPGSIAGYLVNELAQNYGNQAILGGLRAAEKAGRNANKAIKAGVNRFLDGKPEKFRLPSFSLLADIANTNDRTAATRLVAETLQQLNNNPTLAADTISSGTDSLNQLSGDVGVAYQQKMLEVYRVLSENSPPLKQKTSTPFEEEPPALADATISRFERQLDAALNPLGVIEKLSAGNIDGAQVSILKQLYPRLYSRFTSQLLGKAAEKKRSYSIPQQQQISILLGQQVAPSVAPNFVSRMQQNYQNDQEPGRKRRQKRERSLRYETQAQRITSR